MTRIPIFLPASFNAGIWLLNFTEKLVSTHARHTTLDPFELTFPRFLPGRTLQIDQRSRHNSSRSQDQNAHFHTSHIA